MHPVYPQSPPVVLSIATSDSGAGAGSQADLLTFAAHGTYGVTCLAALTAQNPTGVSEIHPLPKEFLRAQFRQLEAYFDIRAAKIGMLFNADLINETVRLLQSLTCPIVVDPVMIASSGASLLADDAQKTLVDHLLPKATLITPNLDEATALLNCPLETPADLRSGVRRLVERFKTAVLLKGGHLPGDDLLDILLLPDGTQLEFTARRTFEVDTHGSGCTLSSAIAAQLAQGAVLPEAVSTAHDYLQRGLHHAIRLGKTRFINHFPPNEMS